MTIINQTITPRWLKLRDACRWSALPRQRLLELIDEGVIKGFQDPDNKRNDWVVDRYSLDLYRESQAGEADAKALAILRSL